MSLWFCYHLCRNRTHNLFSLLCFHYSIYQSYWEGQWNLPPSIAPTWMKWRSQCTLEVFLWDPSNGSSWSWWKCSGGCSSGRWLQWKHCCPLDEYTKWVCTKNHWGNILTQRLSLFWKWPTGWVWPTGWLSSGDWKLHLCTSMCTHGTERNFPGFQQQPVIRASVLLPYLWSLFCHSAHCPLHYGSSLSFEKIDLLKIVLPKHCVEHLYPPSTCVADVGEFLKPRIIQSEQYRHSSSNNFWNQEKHLLHAPVGLQRPQYIHVAGRISSQL